MKTMKTHINLFGLVVISLATLFLSGMEGCGPDEAEEEPVAFTQAVPASGSTIQTDETITITFDGAPTGLSVSGGKFSLAGSTVTIVGPFDPGELDLVLTWTNGLIELTYTVEPDIPPAPEGMVLIPAGEFLMGSSGWEWDSDNDEQPVRKVYVDAFYMDEAEVTNEQFRAFLIENPQWQKDRVVPKFADLGYLLVWDGNNYPDGWGNQPFGEASWYVAVAYAKWAGKRLPTEAEWEYAARGGLWENKYPNGHGISPQDANYARNVGDLTPAGRYPANGYGLYDMAGNVWEWCLDRYNEDFYSTFPSGGEIARNPVSGPSVRWILDNFTTVNVRPVRRGGSWYTEARYVRVANRAYAEPRLTQNHGFRCVKDVTP